MLTEVCSTENNAARRSGSFIAAVAFALLLAACGSEAENGNTATQQSTAGSDRAASETSKMDTQTASESAGGSDKTMMADSSDAAAEQKKEEQKREPLDGYTVYNRFCVTCHRTGLNAAPKFRDKKAWESRIAKGKETLYKNSIEGFKGMPAKGGIAGLYDQEVKDAVDYMVENAGGWGSQE